MSAPEDKLTKEEIAQRRDAGLKALLKMPPKPHSEIVGKGKAKGKADTKGEPNE